MEIFAALADPTRRAIVETLAAREQPVSALVTRFGGSQPAISRHLRVLREAGLVRVRADGQRRLYRVDAKGLELLEAWIETHRRKMARQLDALERYLDEDEKPKGRTR